MVTEEFNVWGKKTDRRMSLNCCDLGYLISIMESMLVNWNISLAQPI